MAGKSPPFFPLYTAKDGGVRCKRRGQVSDKLSAKNVDNFFFSRNGSRTREEGINKVFNLKKLKIFCAPHLRNTGVDQPAPSLRSILNLYRRKSDGRIPGLKFPLLSRFVRDAAERFSFFVFSSRFVLIIRKIRSYCARARDTVSTRT